jgi:hypothetical protein
LCIFIIVIVFLLICMWDFNSIMYVFTYDTRNIWVFWPAHWPSKTFLNLWTCFISPLEPCWFDLRHWKSDKTLLRIIRGIMFISSSFTRMAQAGW